MRLILEPPIEPPRAGLAWHPYSGMFCVPPEYWVDGSWVRWSQYRADPTLGRFTLREQFVRQVVQLEIEWP